MSIYLISALSVVALLVVIMVAHRITHRKPYRLKDLVKVQEDNEKGQLVHVYHHINEIKYGPESFFYADGKLNKQKHWVADKLEGQSITYFENGKKYIMANYANGLLHGDYIIQSIEGKVTQKYQYENGTRIGG